MDFTVRVATPADRDRVEPVLAASYQSLTAPAYEPAAVAAALPLMGRANPVLLAGGTYFVAETRDGVVAGCGGWSLERPGSGEVEVGTAHIRHFAVHPDWTGRGIGRLLYETCERGAREGGARRFQSYATVNAEGFYRALGFRTVGKFDLVMVPGVVLPSLLMERRI